jgi:hypothetical protein
MPTLSFVTGFFLSVLILSCNSATVKTEVRLTPEQVIQKHIDSLKSIAQPGDMIARMNDNIISYHVKNFNYKDKTFSHAGVVVMRNGEKLVCNIDANEKGKDTVRYDPIDSFINPQENFVCGLFRFKLSDAEKENFFKELNAYHDKHVHFDRHYDLETDSLVYCSEMISKSLTRATNGRLTFQEVTTPKPMLMVMTRFFKQEAPKNTPDKTVTKVISERKYIPIDVLYLNPDCIELMRFKLKHFPGDGE